VLETTVRTTTQPKRKAQAFDRLIEQFSEPGDRELVERTIPRSLDEGTDDAPAVDERLWHAHVCYARSRDAGLRRLLVEEYQGYAVSLAQRLHRDSEPLEDLVQVAFEGLLVALNRFEPERGVPFIGFATPTILGSLKRHYRDVGWLVRVPRRVHELAAPARRATDDLTAELGRSPSIGETAERLGVDVEDLIVAQEATNARSTTSLDAMVTPGGRPREHLGAVDPNMAHVDDLLALEQALGELPERDRLVIRRYFFDGRSQVEIAAEFGVSQMQVSRWLSSNLRRLRSWIPAG